MKVGDPVQIDTDIGPVIDWDAKAQLDDYISIAASEGRLIWQGIGPQQGCFCPPVMVRVNGIDHLKKEIFGPVLHITAYKAGSELAVVDAINRSGFGLTFGMHSRIDSNIEAVSAAINVGNVYINRNQIGAVVGSQPFGGHGLSGTGPKAGGPLYLGAFLKNAGTRGANDKKVALSGPSGERNTYMATPIGKKVLVLHTDDKSRDSLAKTAKNFGNEVMMASNLPDILEGVDVVMTNIDNNVDGNKLRKALSEADQRVVPLITDEGGHVWLYSEKHVCRDVTASGGNIDLLMK